MKTRHTIACAIASLLVCLVPMLASAADDAAKASQAKPADAAPKSAAKKKPAKAKTRGLDQDKKKIGPANPKGCEVACNERT